MGLTTGKRETDRIVEILKDPEYPSLPIRAMALLKEMEAILAERAKFVVVGQLKEVAGATIDPKDAPKISMGWYSTQGEALGAADSLWSGVSGEFWRTWVLPVWHGTPHDFHKDRKREAAEKFVEIKAQRAAKIQQQIEARQAKMAAMSRAS